MKKKIFRNNLLVGILVMVLCAVLFVLILFRHYETQTFEQMFAELQYIAHGMELSKETYLDTLDASDRLTWIDADGNVLFDSEADPLEMQNHLNREEVINARETGTGESARWSETLLEYTLYSALRLNDGTIIRVSCTQSSVFAILLTLIWPILGILLAAALLCVILSYRLSKHIVEPINKIDLAHPCVDETYAELHPLVEHIREQNCTISEQMETLKQKQREFSALTDNMCEGFLLLDDKTNVLSSNATAVDVLGTNSEFQNLRLVPVAPSVAASVEEAMAGSHAETIQEINGRSWQIIANPVMVSGQVAGAAVLLMDVTEREQRERLRQEFSANVSHELKTPLTSISGFAELMSEGLVAPDKVAEFSRDIYRESHRLISLVEDIIRLSQLDEGTMFTAETVDLHNLCEEVISSLSSAAETQKISISLCGEHIFVEGIPQLLRDIVFNLCDNAVKYNRPNGSVIINITSAGKHTTLSVSDTGIGIPYADQSRVFERFYRVDKSHSKDVGGTGLGLSIVKHAVQYHKASISLSSVPDKGTTITVVF